MFPAVYLLFSFDWFHDAACLCSHTSPSTVLCSRRIMNLWLMEAGVWPAALWLFFPLLSSSHSGYSLEAVIALKLCKVFGEQSSLKMWAKTFLRLLGGNGIMVFSLLPFCPPNVGLLWNWFLWKLGLPLLQLQQLPCIALQAWSCLQSLLLQCFSWHLFGCIHVTAPSSQLAKRL